MGFEFTTLMVIGTVCIGIYKSNCHMITTVPAMHLEEFKHIQKCLFFLYVATMYIITEHVGMLTTGAVDRGSVHRSGQTTDYEIGICCFSATHATLKNFVGAWSQLIVTERLA